ncbi:hypothetical protein [Deferrisoma camini]|uniref:hypothetical protein n=1 Tax=Deferrisoma camini TaxID=1035120 RepID=UPI00046CA9AE|nr:hypothetical protein [Deferrisoma camini]
MPHAAPPTPPNAPPRYRHLTGWRAWATVGCGLGLGALAGRTGLQAARLEPGWVFWALSTLVLAGASLVVTTLPWRLTSRFDDRGIWIGWALGRLRVPWPAVRRVVIGSLGSGGQRDPFTVTLLLRDGREVLYLPLGRRRPEDVPAAAALLDEAERRGLRIENTLATPEEIVERERRWREARLKGWR